MPPSGALLGAECKAMTQRAGETTFRASGCTPCTSFWAERGDRAPREVAHDDHGMYRAASFDVETGDGARSTPRTRWDTVVR